MKIRVIPSASMGGHKCYNFPTRALRDAWLSLTGRKSASAEKLQSLSAFGVDIEHEKEDTDSTTSPTT